MEKETRVKKGKRQKRGNGKEEEVRNRNGSRNRIQKEAADGYWKRRIDSREGV